MNTRKYRGLIALNLVLLGVLALVVLAPSASGDQTGATRGRGSYAMLSGRIQGSSTGALWIVDDTNQELVVLRYNQSQRTMNFIGYRNLAKDSGANVRKGR